MTRLLRSLPLAVALLAVGCPTPLPEVDAPSDVAPPDVPSPDVRTGMCSGDDECSDGNYCNGRERCDAMAPSADARGCAAPRGRPCLDVQVCEEATDTCVTDCGVDRDADDDGVDASGCGGMDCDDADPLRHAGATEVCDAENRDEDCDATTFGDRDLDRDGAVAASCCNVNAAGADVCGTDCDDTKRSVRPLGTELCDGLDNDCNGAVDEGVTRPGFADLDADLHGDPMARVMACPGSARVSTVDDDCMDGERSVHGSQVEICDMLDNDCDGRTDEHTRPVTWYADRDGDGFGAASSGTVVSCEPVTGHSLLPTDCDDDNRSRSPIADEICDGADDDCNGIADFRIGINDREDDDGDGHFDASCGGDDCDDGDASAYLGAPEICDFRDSDCDGLSDLGAEPPAGAMADTTDEIDWFADIDGDLYGTAIAPVRSCPPVAGRVSRSLDCADDDPSTHPGAVDICNAGDDDCDTRIDEDAAPRAYYADVDADGDGAGAASIECAPAREFSELPGDCAPTDPDRGPSTYELCNGVDDDCDTRVDELLFRDVDGDGHGDPMVPVVGACSLGDVGRGDDCNDLVSSLHPELTEICNGLDDDCDGEVDEPGAELCVAGTDHGMCMGGSCAFTCAMGEADCDGDPATGCEATLANDPSHCGRCGLACGVAGSCTAGVCDPIVGVSVGPTHGCAWRGSGSVLCWGANASGELGNPAIAVPSPGPVAVPGVLDATEVCSGQGFSCARRRGGEVVCWGTGGFGERGQGVETGGPDPVAVPGLGDATDIACAYDRACALRATGRVRCWGGGASAQFGSVEAGPHPRDVTGMSDVASIEMYPFFFDLCAVTSDGRMLAVGTPALVGGGGFAAVTDFSALFPGPIDSVTTSSLHQGCVRLRSGALWCWGNSDDFADAGPLLASTPREVDAGIWAGATDLAIASGSVMCGVLPDGRVTCSGNCGANLLRGDGCGVARAYGTFVTGLSDATSIDAYDDRFCAVRGRGDAVCWGMGALGSGSTSSAVPLRIASD